MKTIVLFALISLVVAETDYYKMVDEHFDVDALMANRVALRAFLYCFEDKAPCTDEILAHKTNLQEAVQTACRRCSPNFKYLFWRFIQGVKEYSPEEYWNFRHYFDPENKFFDALEQDISRYVKPDMELIVN